MPTKTKGSRKKPITKKTASKNSINIKVKVDNSKKTTNSNNGNSRMPSRVQIPSTAPVTVATVPMHIPYNQQVAPNWQHFNPYFSPLGAMPLPQQALGTRDNNPHPPSILDEVKTYNNNILSKLDNVNNNVKLLENKHDSFVSNFTNPSKELVTAPAPPRAPLFNPPMKSPGQQNVVDELKARFSKLHKPLDDPQTSEFFSSNPKPLPLGEEKPRQSLLSPKIPTPIKTFEKIMSDNAQVTDEGKLNLNIKPIVEQIGHETAERFAKNVIQETKTVKKEEKQAKNKEKVSEKLNIYRDEYVKFYGREPSPTLLNIAKPSTAQNRINLLKAKNEYKKLYNEYFGDMSTDDFNEISNLSNVDDVNAWIDWVKDEIETMKKKKKGKK